MKFTPFLYCCALNAVECAKILIKHPQIDPNIPTTGYVKNHIEFVLQNANGEMLNFLLENEKIKIEPVNTFAFNSYFQEIPDVNEKSLAFCKKALENINQLRVRSFLKINYLFSYYLHQKRNALPIVLVFKYVMSNY